MAKGLKTKGGRIMQFILLAANPNLFDPNGKRIVCSNFEEYTFEDGQEYDRIRRQGAKALHANVPLEAMHAGTAKGTLNYNLVDDQILPYLVAKPISDTTSGGFREREYRRPQFDRADRAFFAVQEGLPSDCELGGFGMFTGFKFSSARGNKGVARFDLNFVTQVAIGFGNMTGSVPQNSKWVVNAANVTGDLVVGYLVPGGTQKQVTMAIGDLVAGTKTKFESNNDGVTVSVAGVIATGTGEKHTVAGTGNTFTIYGDIVVDTAVDTLATVQAKIRLKAGRSSAVVSGTITKPMNNLFLGKTATSVPNTGTAANAIDGDPATTYNPPGQTPAPFTLTVDRGVGAADAGVASISITKQDANFCPVESGRVETSADGNTWDVLIPNAGIYYGQAGTWTVVAPANAIAKRFVRLVQDTSNSAFNSWSINEVVLTPTAAVQGTANLAIQYDSAAGNVVDIEAVPGAGYIGTSTQLGSAGGSVLIEFTSPANQRVIMTKVSGHAGYTLAEQQMGSDGNIIGSIVEPNPVMPAHITLYRADTFAGLNDSVTPTKSNAAALVGKVQTFDYDDSKICAPQSHHQPINDPLRPNLPPTYDSFAEEETEEDGVKLTVTIDCDDVENGHVTTLLTDSKAVVGGGRYISKPSYWRAEMISPKDNSRIRVEFYGSIGTNTPRKFNGNIEQRTFVMDLIENRELAWALRWLTRVPV